MAGPEKPLDRFRSFAERYVISRAEHFKKGSELEDGWAAIQDAKKLYDMIARVPDPEAQRGESANAAHFMGVPLSASDCATVRRMMDTGVPWDKIYTWLSHRKGHTT